jgi:dihydroorotate dehydrogenase (NAD+) catalytic subunit
MKLKNPVLVASGTFGYGEEFARYAESSKLGAIVTKTITKNPRQGQQPPRVTETVGGMLNAIGLQNEGLKDFIENKIPRLKRLATNVIVSVGGETNAEYAEVVGTLDAIPTVDAFEINISCPNLECRDKIIAKDETLTHDVVAAVRRVTKRPLIVKLSPNVDDITCIARAAERAGADAIALINTLLGMAIDIKTHRPVLANITGGLSGPAIKPIALRMVWQVHNCVTIPIVGMGGIMSAEDAVEFFLAGATAVAVGTANFVNPSASVDIVQGLGDYLKKHRIKDVRELIGGLVV